MNMDRRMKELAAVEAAITELEECEGDYSLNDIADLTSIPTRLVRKHIYDAGCRPEWVKLRNKLTPSGYWALND